MRSPGLSVVLTLVSAMCCAPSLRAQDPAQDWEGKTVSNILLQGFVHENKAKNLGYTGLAKDKPITRAMKDQAIKELFKTGKFQYVDLKVEDDKANPGKVLVTLMVTEYIIVEKVEFKGINEIPIGQLKPTLRLSAGEPLNPFHLKQDREYIREQYLSKGYHFSSVEESTEPGTTGVNLTWNVVEGPLVSVQEIILTGTITADESRMRQYYLISKENGTFLGLFNTTHAPFVERNLRDDVDRVKLFYRMEGWLDIQHGDHVFLEDLIFSEDKTRVTIKIHIDEGERYKIRQVRFEFDPASRRIFSEAEMASWLTAKPGEPYTENNANADVAKIREKYGERAYIQAEITHSEVVSLDKRELDLVYSIKENDKVYLGRLIFEGNTKTREDVLRREFTRTGFLPGEEYNASSLQLALQRIKDRQLIEQQAGGLNMRTVETDDPRTRDVILDVKEGQTGTVRFAAGYSSSFGITGLVEFTQRNFDLADLPTSFEDLIGGTGFAGGGQFLRLRASPSARRQSYSIEFREPYFFGYEFEFGLRLYDVSTLWEAWDERRLGAAITVGKRLDPFTLQLTLDGYQINMGSVQPNAPVAVKEIAGTHSVYTLIPAIILDLRDSVILPTSGFKVLISETYGGQFLPGSFDFHKFAFEAEAHFPIHETDNHLRHVLSFQFTFGLGSGMRGTPDLPIFERFYAGGRDRPRGFDYRGMGPHENFEPVGGDALVLATAEYTFPIFVEFLRGAFFFDLGSLTSDIYGLQREQWRSAVGFGFRFFVPQLGNIPIKLDFGFPLSRQLQDRRQTVTFDIGTLGF